MKILVINGPNLNMLGVREPEIYGELTLKKIEEEIRKNFEQVCEIEFYQSNHEGEIVDKIQSALNNFQGILINPAAYTHTSIAILDALKAVNIPTVEVHISDINQREEFRKHSFVSYYALKMVAGLGLNSYIEGMKALIENINE